MANGLSALGRSWNAGNPDGRYISVRGLGADADPAVAPPSEEQSRRQMATFILILGLSALAFTYLLKTTQMILLGDWDYEEGAK